MRYPYLFRAVLAASFATSWTAHAESCPAPCPDTVSNIVSGYMTDAPPVAIDWRVANQRVGQAGGWGALMDESGATGHAHHGHAHPGNAAQVPQGGHHADH
jgi:hypothetical protein